MAKPELVASRDFTYMTRRLTAGDTFQARNALEAKILTSVRRVAEVPKPKAAVREPAPAPEPEPAAEPEMMHFGESEVVRLPAQLPGEESPASPPRTRGKARAKK